MTWLTGFIKRSKEDEVTFSDVGRQITHQQGIYQHTQHSTRTKYDSEKQQTTQNAVKQN